MLKYRPNFTRNGVYPEILHSKTFPRNVNSASPRRTFGEAECGRQSWLPRKSYALISGTTSILLFMAKGTLQVLLVYLSIDFKIGGLSWII